MKNNSENLASSHVVTKDTTIIPHMNFAYPAKVFRNKRSSPIVLDKSITTRHLERKVRSHQEILTTRHREPLSPQGPKLSEDGSSDLSSNSNYDGVSIQSDFSFDNPLQQGSNFERINYDISSKPITDINIELSESDTSTTDGVFSQRKDIHSLIKSSGNKSAAISLKKDNKPTSTTTAINPRERRSSTEADLSHRRPQSSNSTPTRPRSRCSKSDVQMSSPSPISLTTTTTTEPLRSSAESAKKPLPTPLSNSSEKEAVPSPQRPKSLSISGNKSPLISLKPPTKSPSKPVLSHSRSAPLLLDCVSTPPTSPPSKAVVTAPDYTDATETTETISTTSRTTNSSSNSELQVPGVDENIPGDTDDTAVSAVDDRPPPLPLPLDPFAAALATGARCDVNGLVAICAWSWTKTGSASAAAFNVLRQAILPIDPVGAYFHVYQPTELHCTVATLSSFKAHNSFLSTASESMRDEALLVWKDAFARALLNQGHPRLSSFSLRAERVSVEPTACIIRMSDPSGGMTGLRTAVHAAVNDEVLRQFEVKHGLPMGEMTRHIHFPDIVHSTFVRFIHDIPALMRSALEAVAANWQPVDIEVSTVYLVHEYAPYMHVDRNAALLYMRSLAPCPSCPSRSPRRPVGVPIFVERVVYKGHDKVTASVVNAGDTSEVKEEEKEREAAAVAEWDRQRSTQTTDDTTANKPATDGRTRSFSSVTLPSALWHRRTTVVGVAIAALFVWIGMSKRKML